MSSSKQVFGHIPVLLDEVINLLDPKPGDTVLDVTLGLGGHSSVMAQRIQPGGHLVALDADTSNLETARKRLADYDGVTLIHTNFSALPGCLPEGRRTFDVILADLGLSSPHVDDASRGFTFRSDAPLDMRYDQTSGMSAAELLSQWDPMRLRKILKDYGEISGSGVLVDAIVAHRATGPIDTSNALVSLVKDVFGYRAEKILPQIFQALRIAVNDELCSLERLLDVAPALLNPGGRIGIISYHSLEDSIVKRRFRQLTAVEKDIITGKELTEPMWIELSRKGITPNEAEIRKNPRARSARFRALSKVCGV